MPDNNPCVVCHKTALDGLCMLRRKEGDPWHCELHAGASEEYLVQLAQEQFVERGGELDD